MKAEPITTMAGSEIRQAVTKVDSTLGENWTKPRENYTSKTGG